MTKITYVDALNAVINGQPLTDEVISKLTALRDQQVKRNSGDTKKPTKVQQENEAHKAAIVDFLATCTAGVSATEVMNACVLTSNQKAAALLKSLVDNGKVLKDVVKGKALFRLA